MSKLAVIQVRGTIGANRELLDTLKSLNLDRKNYCVVVDNNPHYVGMLAKAKDYITWGEIDETTLKALVDKRGEDKKYFRLSPPRKGYGKKGLKHSFKEGGAFGNRGAKINDLIQRML